tara:strand:- start:321 stop:725 length:405 start_codon:yes stop_codon:yes gene_type:complete
MSKIKLDILKIFILINSFSIIFVSCISNNIDNNNREYDLYSQIMCPVCDGQTIAESQASISNDMKKMITSQISEGKTDKEILNYFKERYGQEIISNPSYSGFNITVWIAPILIILGSLLLLIYSLRKNMHKAKL